MPEPVQDPVALLDEAEEVLRSTAWETSADVIAAAQVLATIGQGRALLMPSPDEVIAAFQETQGEVLTEEMGKMVVAVERAKEILDRARAQGPRHPAILAALEVFSG